MIPIGLLLLELSITECCPYRKARCSGAGEPNGDRSIYSGAKAFHRVRREGKEPMINGEEALRALKSLWLLKSL